MEKKQCRSPSGENERLTEAELIKMMRHSSYERGANGRIRARGGRGTVIK